ncbi:MAG: hypothetical protein AAF715_10375 [Myxococcota bacterium]
MTPLTFAISWLEAEISFIASSSAAMRSCPVRAASAALATDWLATTAFRALAST